jgi:hypothetical protein
VARLQIQECAEQLSRVEEDPLRLVMAAKAAHLALQAALTAALAGSIGIGAYNATLEQRWLAFLQDGAPAPDKRRVLEFKSLLEKARSRPLEWTQEPLILSDDEAAALEKLTAIRDCIEHTKPGVWVIEPAFIKPLIPIAIDTAMRLLRGVHHHFESGEMETAEEVAAEISRRCGGGA